MPTIIARSKKEFINAFSSAGFSDSYTTVILKGQKGLLPNPKKDTVYQLYPCGSYGNFEDREKLIKKIVSKIKKIKECELLY